ncbi:hypothetical protein A2881_02465 [Candidatus Peribacteria bacterium RIFCSPHIGHO2_01_FULL_55_13]|nr:MAG: hypothetical protein A2881_02465 [Candidatus Peribacteria bacterium RIFCSPHIGHO2_01_FULL_55_13]OGJ64614.1 MAG: hypothetical protein A3F36_01475 [Candidatus Peribacteria bacterium RIFCSPHIGHO2_12_FULL_55_11]
MSNENGVDVGILSRHIEGRALASDTAQELFDSVGALTDEGTIREIFLPHLDAFIRAIDSLKYGKKEKLSHNVEDGWSLETLKSELQNQNADAQLVAARLLRDIVRNGKTIGLFIQSIGAPKAVAQVPVEPPAVASSDAATDASSAGSAIGTP